MSVLYSSQNQLHSKSQQISWKNKAQTAQEKENCLSVAKLIFSQSSWRGTGKSSSPFNAWGPVNVNYPQNPGKFHPCRKSFQEPGQKLWGKRKKSSPSGKNVSAFVLRKSRRTSKYFLSHGNFPLWKFQSSNKLYYHRNMYLMKNKLLNINLIKQKLLREVQLCRCKYGAFRVLNLDS